MKAGAGELPLILALTAALLAGCASSSKLTSESSAISSSMDRYHSANYPTGGGARDLDLTKIAASSEFFDHIIYRARILPTTGHDQRVYRLHLYAPKGPAVWVAKTRTSKSEPLIETQKMISADQTNDLMQAIRETKIFQAEGKCPPRYQLQPDGRRTPILQLNDIIADVEMVYRGRHFQARCSMGRLSPVDAVVREFVALNGDAYPGPVREPIIE